MYSIYNRRYNLDTSKQISETSFLFFYITMLKTKENGLDVAIKELEDRIKVHPDPFYIKMLERLRKIRDSPN